VVRTLKRAPGGFELIVLTFRHNDVIAEQKQNRGRACRTPKPVGNASPERVRNSYRALKPRFLKPIRLRSLYSQPRPIFGLANPKRSSSVTDREGKIAHQTVWARGFRPLIRAPAMLSGHETKLFVGLIVLAIR
jgi:hypothetical protein